MFFKLKHAYMRHLCPVSPRGQALVGSWTSKTWVSVHVKNLKSRPIGPHLLQVRVSNYNKDPLSDLRAIPSLRALGQRLFLLGTDCSWFLRRPRGRASESGKVYLRSTFVDGATLEGTPSPMFIDSKYGPLVWAPILRWYILGI